MADQYEELLDRLRDEYDVPDDVLDPLKGSSLRQRLRDAEQKATRADKLEAELSSMKKSPKREEAFRKAGVDFDALRPAERRAIEGFDWDGEAPDAQKVADFIRENEFPTGEFEEEEEEPPAAAAVVQHAVAHRGDASSTTLRPEDVGEWSTERLIRFREQNPEAFEELKRGNTVRGVTVPGP